jgi:NADPH-ferrihemoprotein reductase
MPTTIEALLRYYLQICGRLSRETLFALTAFAPSTAAKDELKRISDTASAFKAEVLDQKLTLADLLTGISGGAKWDVPESFLVERLSTMQPRYYSICSSAAVEPRTISITVVVEKPLKPVQRGCWGLATSYLHALEQHMNCSGFIDSALAFALDGPRNNLSGSHVYGRVRRSKFKPPFKASTPIIMIGCGTGVAPFRAFVQELVQRKKIGHETGKALLFVGFRRPDEDFIYAEEWREAQAALGRDNLKLYPAFSREDPSRRMYVQDRLREHANEVLDLFESDFQTRMYICGSAEMSRDVSSTLVEIRRDAKGESLEQANEWVKRLRQMKLLLEDVWS